MWMGSYKAYLQLVGAKIKILVFTPKGSVGFSEVLKRTCFLVLLKALHKMKVWHGVFAIDS